MSRSNALALLALAASCALLSLMGCATPVPACKPPEAVHLMVDADGSWLVSDEVALVRDGVDRNCKAAR